LIIIPVSDLGHLPKEHLLRQ